MAVIACPGCGLPRADDQVGLVPCPVCAAAPAPATPVALPRAGPVDPTAGLPADASQLESYSAHAADRARGRFAVAAAFLLGIAAGVGGLLAAQRAWRPATPESDARAVPAPEPTDFRPSLPAAVAAAPVPHEPREALTETAPETTPEPKPEAKAEPEAPALARKVVIDLNQPEVSYTVPSTVRKGEHLVLRGKVRMLRVNGLNQGAVLDASALEAGSVYVSGKIDGGSHLKITCVDGVVEVPAAVTGKSRVEIDAPGGSVRFIHPTTPNKPGSFIDGGSTVSIRARTVDLRGDVGGAGTRVGVTITRNGWLRVAAVRGTAAVEYRPDDPNAREPSAGADTVAPTATFRKAD
jgi:hypothetical protein